MSGDRFTREEGSSTLSRIPCTKKTPSTANALSSAMPKDVRHRLQRTERPVRPIQTDVPKENLLKQLGKRKWRPTKDGYGPTSFVEWLDDDYGISSISEDAPVAPSGKYFKGRRDLRPSVLLDSVVYLPEPGEDDSWGQFEWSRKRLRRQPHEQPRRVFNSIQAPVNHYPRQPADVTYLTEDVLSLEKLYQATKRTQRCGLTDATTDNVVVDRSPALESGPDHPLSKLKWPFEGGFCDVETNRGGGGGGSQPSTTGSQGFPQFITAGPSMSLFGHDLFGYDRESLVEYASWA